MFRDNAIQIAEKSRVQDNNQQYSFLSTAEKRYIEVTETLDCKQAGMVRDVLSWIIVFQKGTAWYEYAIDDGNGQIIRRRWSRWKSV